MNTAANCMPTILPTRPTLLRRLERAVVDAWAAWRARSRLHAELRALQALSDATLRDIGLAERVLDQPGLSALDYERGRW